MRRFRITIVLALATLLFVSTSSAQQASTTSVPNLIRYSGTLKDAQGAALPSSTAVGVTFSIYKQQDGGTAVWMETQNVTPDSNGQYSVVLGSTTAIGLPDDLFSQQEQRWLGVQVQGEAEQARVMLVSVPYAFKAHEAEMLGGLPASAFVKAPPFDVAGSGAGDVGTAVNALGGVGSAVSGANRATNLASVKNPQVPVINGPCLFGVPVGAQGYIPIWNNPPANSTVICNSVIFQNPARNIGIGTTTPIARLDVNGFINDSAGYKIAGNGVLLINRFLSNLVVGGNSPNINGAEFNTFTGIDAGLMDTTGYANTFSGADAGYANTQGQHNTFTGTQTGSRNITGSFNSFFGASAGLQNNADNNTFVGGDAGFLTTTGSNNTFLGAEAGNSNLVGSFNTFSGREAGFNSTASHGSFYGYKAGYSNTADGNSFFGDQAGFSNTTQSGNAFFGYQAGYSSTVDFFGGLQNGNTFIGYQAGFSDTMDAGNSFFGYQAGYRSNASQGHLTGNTFVGSGAGYSNVDGTANTYVGFQAGISNEGNGNAFFGVDTGLNLFSGFGNTFLGVAAGGSFPRGDLNIFVGLGADNLGGGSDNIYIGNAQATSESHTIRIGTQQTGTYIAGIYGASPGDIPKFVCVDKSGKLWGSMPPCEVIVSSRRFKEQIADMAERSNNLYQLRPVSFFYMPQYDDGSHLQQYGLIAEEVAKVYPEMVAYDKDGQPYTVHYQMLAPMLLNELQKQHTVVVAQQGVIKTKQEQANAQQQRMQAQQQQIEQLQQRLSRLETLTGQPTRAQGQN